jgi:Tc toxin complex TcA C-terminal TcB-binding domain
MASITITEPTNGQTFYTISGQPINVVVRGSYVEANGDEGITISGAPLLRPVSWGDGEFMAIMRIDSPGNPIIITANLNWQEINEGGKPPIKNFNVFDKQSIAVIIDTVAPTVQIQQPSLNSSIVIAENNGSFNLIANVQDVGVGVDASQIEWHLDGVDNPGLHTEGRGFVDKQGAFVTTVSWPINFPVPGKYAVKVRATDRAGNVSGWATTAQFFAEDQTFPNCAIKTPFDGYRLASGQKLIVEVFAQDKQSGLAKLEWSLDDGPMNSIPLTGVTANLPIDVGSSIKAEKHSLSIYCTDNAGNRSVLTPSQVLNFEVLTNYIPKTIYDLLSPREYLQQLLSYSKNHINTNFPDPKRQLTVEELENVFFQPFNKLAEGSDSDPLKATKPINQLRAVIEVLRNYWTKTSTSTDTPPNEVNYYLAAYRALLSSIGTSYDEIRLVRGEPDRRRAVAKRLGFPEIASPDCIEQLFLAPADLTDTTLKDLFGLPDSQGDVPAKATILRLRHQSLLAEWQTDDRTRFSIPGKEIPIIDPDLIDENDLAIASAGSISFNFLVSRRTWLSEKRLELSSNLIGSPQERMNSVLNTYLGHTSDEFIALAARAQLGEDINATLLGWQLTNSGFKRLVSVLNLANSSSAVVTDSEWEEVVDIVLRTQKLKQYSTWRNQEITGATPIVLEPSNFKIAHTSKILNPWLADLQARIDWQDLLRSRTDTWNGAAASLNATIESIDEQTLPLLRDAIVAAVAKKENKEQDVAAEWLTSYLLVDAKAGSAQQTTRTFQAIQTLQSLLFSLRAKQLDPNHPAHLWRLAYTETTDLGVKVAKEAPIEHFDEEWKWMGGYDSWRGARLVFYYPENLLLPSLRTDAEQTEAFKTLVLTLRAKGRVTPKIVREAVKEYQKGFIASTTTISDQSSDEALNQIKAECAQKFSVIGLANPITRRQTQEYYYFVPMEAALKLQKSREYVAALAWFRSVYAYDRDPQNRKIYRLLELEDNNAAVLSEGAHWLMEDINPHVTASLRNQPGGANPYTRFTLMSIVRCLLEYGDAEFTYDTGESIARARNLYLTARRILSVSDLDEPKQTSLASVRLPNPMLDILRARVELQIAKLRQGRNVAGLKRTLEVAAPQSTLANDMPQIGAGGQVVIPGIRPVPRPTPYRFSVLVERSKQLVNIAQQMEAVFLSTLEKRDKENFDRLQASNGLELAKATEGLQKMRSEDTQKAVDLANFQVMKAQFASETYQEWIDQGLTAYEDALIGLYGASGIAQTAFNNLNTVLVSAQAIIAGAAGQLGTGVAAVPAAIIAAGLSASAQNAAISIDTSIKVTSVRATQERRAQEWELSKWLSTYDFEIAGVQKQIAIDQQEIAKQEYDISRTQSAEAKAVVDFLATKFTGAELYDWMSRILGEVYSFFLQQSTAVAKLAQDQLSFERQESGLSFIQADYWEGPSEAAAGPSNAPNRQGLTGSARLLQDIYRMDQFAFETDKRKLNLTQTFSLSKMTPFEFQRFKETGVLPFRTTINLFDRAFPGHYMRLIKQVRVSVVALIPPQLGIRATLRTVGSSWVVTGGDLFARKQLPSRSDLVALTSPVSATGVFELDTQSEMLRPFEGMGVDTAWQFELPKASNPFDFDSIADVLISIDYTAFNSDEYRGQVTKTLDPKIQAQLAFSLKNDFPDQWYDLNNPDQQANPFSCEFELPKSNFPPHVEGLAIEGLLLYFKMSSDATSEVKISNLTHVVKTSNGEVSIGGEAKTDENGIARYDSQDRPRGETGNWKSLMKEPPVGKWKLTLDSSIRQTIASNHLEDILFIVSFSGRGPDWT